MDKISLNEYKNYLVNKYIHECDNNETERTKRESILNTNYKDEFLESIIIGTYDLVAKIIEMSENDYYGYIKLPLECEPNMIHINLNLTGGWVSDIVVKDSLNNFYSIGLLKEVFGDFFTIEPDWIEMTEEYDEIDDDISILSEIPSYYLYIQCKKEIIDNVKNDKVLAITKKN